MKRASGNKHWHRVYLTNGGSGVVGQWVSAVGQRSPNVAVSRWIEHQTGWSIRKFVPTARRYRTIQIQVGEHTITAADPLPDDLRQALDHIHGRTSAH